MNDIIQHILVFIALGFAIFFLVKKFFIKETSSNNSCGKGSDCECH
jgi:large-conductance mechanosensitive channel